MQFFIGICLRTYYIVRARLTNAKSIIILFVALCLYINNYYTVRNIAVTICTILLLFRPTCVINLQNIPHYNFTHAIIIQHLKMLLIF